jgi:hypothetical protein
MNAGQRSFVGVHDALFWTRPCGSEPKGGPEVNRSREDVPPALQEELGIPGVRVYLNMANVRGEDWRHDGGMFG